MLNLDVSDLVGGDLNHFSRDIRNKEISTMSCHRVTPPIINERRWELDSSHSLKHV